FSFPSWFRGSFLWFPSFLPRWLACIQLATSTSRVFRSSFTEKNAADPQRFPPRALFPVANRPTWVRQGRFRSWLESRRGWPDDREGPVLPSFSSPHTP